MAKARGSARSSRKAGTSKKRPKSPTKPKTPTMTRPPKQPKPEKKVTRYTYDHIKEPRTPETGHTPLLPTDEQLVALPMDNGWSKAIIVGKLPEDADSLFPERDEGLLKRLLFGNEEDGEVHGLLSLVDRKVPDTDFVVSPGWRVMWLAPLR